MQAFSTDDLPISGILVETVKPLLSPSTSLSAWLLTEDV